MAPCPKHAFCDIFKGRPGKGTPDPAPLAPLRHGPASGAAAPMLRDCQWIGRRALLCEEDGIALLGPLAHWEAGAVREEDGLPWIVVGCVGKCRMCVRNFNGPSPPRGTQQQPTPRGRRPPLYPREGGV